MFANRDLPGRLPPSSRSAHAVVRFVFVLTFLLAGSFSVLEAQEEQRTPGSRRTPEQRRKVQTRRRTRPTPPKPKDEQEAEKKVPEKIEPSQGSEKVKIDPDVQKRIDEFFEKQGEEHLDGSKTPAQRTPSRAPARTRTIPQTTRPTGGRLPETAGAATAQRRPVTRGMPSPRGVDRGATPPGESEAINIAPSGDQVPPEQRLYGFSIKNGTYAQLVEGFARQTGLGVLGDAPKGGDITFVTTQELAFADALQRVRMLLFNSSPHDPYWIQRLDTHLQVIRVTDIFRILPRDRMFRSIDAFHAANVPDDELVLTIYTPKTGALSDLKQIRDFMPDYVRVDPQGDTAVSIFALARDVRKYLWLIDFFGSKGSDPRSFQRFQLQHVTPSQAVETIQTLLGDENVRKQRRAAGRGGREQSVLDTLPEPEMVILPEEANSAILVYAMADRIAEIEALIPWVDVDPGADLMAPAMIEVQHAELEDIITAVKQVLDAGGGAAPSASRSRSKRRVRGRKTKSDASAVEVVGGPTLIPHPSGRAIVVLAEVQDEVDEIRKLVEMFDVPATVGPLRIPLEYGDADDIATTVFAVMGVDRKKPGSERFRLAADPGGDALWYTGSEDDLKYVNDMVASLDAGGEEVKLHSIILKNNLPSFVANILKEFDGEGGGTSKPRRGGRTRRRGRTTASKDAAATVNVAKFTPDDENGILYAICSEQEWAEYLVIIEQLEAAITRPEAFVRIPLEHADPNDAVEKLQGILESAGEDMAAVGLVASDASILVVGATEDQVEQVRIFLPEVDKPKHFVQRTFDIKYADPDEIKSAIESLVGEEPAEAGRPTRRRAVAKKDAAAPTVAVSESDTLMVLRVGDRLVVETTPEKMLEVEAIVAEFDVDEGGTEMRVYADFPPGADINAVADTLTSYMSSSPKRGRRRGGSAVAAPGDEGATFIPQPQIGKLVVIAPPDDFAEIEQLLEVLKTPGSMEAVVVQFIPVRHADPEELVVMIEPLLSMQVRRMVAAGDIEPVDVSGETAGVPKKGGGRLANVRRARAGDDAPARFQLTADVRNRRLVIAATEAVVELARDLVAEFDTPIEDDDVIFRTVPLENTSAEDMVKSIRELMGSAGPTGARRVRRAPPGAASPTGDADPAELSVVAAPGGDAVVLNGPRAEVEQAEVWIRDLDAQALSGKEIKIYEIVRSDIERLVDVIMNVVDQPEAKSPARAPRRRPAARPSRPGMEAEPEEDPFETTKSYTGSSIYIQADMVSRTLVVVATAAKLEEVDAIVARFEADPEDGGPVLDKPELPKQIFELEYADSLDASFNLQMLLAETWSPSSDTPSVMASGFGNALVVEYHDKSRFPEIEKLIDTYIDKPNIEDTGRKSIPVPEGMSAEALALWLKMNLSELDVEVIDITEPTPEYDIEQVLPPASQRRSARPRRGTAPCVLPLSAMGMIRDLTASVILAQQPEQDPPPQEEPPIEEEEGYDDYPIDDLPVDAPTQMFRDALQDSGPEDVGGNEKPIRMPRKGEKLKVYYDSTKGAVIIEGPESLIDNSQDWLERIKEELKDVYVAPDIRHYRVRYIDVFTAKDIIEEMFNATRDQRNAVSAAQRRAQAAQQRAQRQRNNRQNQQQGGDQDDQRGNPRGNQRDNNQRNAQVPQLPPTTVRVYPNPRDRTLILRADTNQFPAIMELLATIDQPQPINSELKTFPLEKLNAVEVEELLSDLLGLNEAPQPQASQSSSRRSRSRRGGGSAGGSNPNFATLPQTIVQEMVTGAGKLGINPGDISLSSNEVTNSIIVMAPPAAIEFVADTIRQLESGDIPDRVTRYYELDYADTVEVAEYLVAQFAEQDLGGSPAQPGRRARRGGDSGGGGLNTPSFVPYPRLNMLTVVATEEQHAEVAEIITRLDVQGVEDKWETVELVAADAAEVASTLTQMFGGGSGRSSSRGRGSTVTVSGDAGPRFLGNEGGKTVFYTAPPAMKEDILSAIAKLEADAETQTNQLATETIALEHAQAEMVAESLTRIFEDKKRAHEALAGRMGGTSPIEYTVVVTPDPVTNKLFVQASEENMELVRTRVAELDNPDAKLSNTPIRIYPLRFAEPEAVAQMIMQWERSRTQGAPRGSTASSMDSVLAVAEPGTRTLVVKASESNHLIIKDLLDGLDDESLGGALQRQRIVLPLEFGDATSVAQALSQLFREGGNRRRGDTGPTFVADPNSNAVVANVNEEERADVEAILAQIDTDDAVAGGVIKVIPIENGDAAEMQAALEEYLRKPGGGGRRGGGELIGDVRVSVLAQSNAIVISGTEETVVRLEEVVAALDAVGEGANQPQIVMLTHARSADILPTLEEMFVGKGTRRGPRGGGGGEETVITANEAIGEKGAIIVRATPTEFSAIKSVIESLDTEEAAEKPNFRIISVATGINVTDLADKIQQSVNEGAAANYRGSGGGRGGQVPSIIATPDARTGSIVVSGAPALFDDAERLAQAMEKMGPSGGRETRILSPKKLSAEEVQALIDQLTGGESSGASSRRSGSSRSRRGSTPSRQRTTRRPPRG